MKYQIILPVKNATGHQTFSVEAETELEARAKFDAGLADFVCEEIEASDVGDPEITLE